MKTGYFLAGVFSLSLSFAPDADAKVWTDSSGQHQIVAEFVSLDGGEVTLKAVDGKIIKLPLDKLSEADQEFAKAEAAKPATSPPVPTPPAAGEGGGGTAAEVVNQFASQLEAGKMQALDFLPPSYVKDLDGLVAEFGNSMDPSLWNAALELGRDIGYILTEKKDIVTKSKFFGMADATGELSKNYDQTASTWSGIFNNQALTLEEMKKGNSSALLQELAAGIANSVALVPEPDVAEGVKKFSEMKAEVISETGDTAMLRLTTPSEPEPLEMEFKKVDGKWIPSEMATGWSEMISSAKAGLGMMKTPEFEQGKTQALMMLGAVSGIVSQLKTAETVEDFDAKIQGLMGMMGMMGGGDAGATPPGAVPPGAPAPAPPVPVPGAGGF